MNLYLLRHGEAGQHRPSADDWKRDLTPEGVTRMKRQAATLARWKIPLEMILSSPFPRARQTADAVAEVFSLTVTEDKRLESMKFNLNTLEGILTDHIRVKNLLVAGHEPDFSTVLSELISGSRNAQIKMAKGGLACVDMQSFRPPRGELLWFLTPELMGAEG